MKVAVILPSRGLIFSRTAEEILNNVKGIPHRFYFAHGLPLPDCFEAPLTKALKDTDITHVWFVEDDMVLPPDTLKKMLEADKPVVTVNYPTTDRGDAAVLTIKGETLYGGTGCTLVKRKAFDILHPPYFRTDIVWTPKNKGDHIKFTARRKTGGGYGLHDVNFFMNLYQRGIPVHVMDFTLGQRKLIALGKQGSNNGAHKIKEWKRVKKDRYFTLIRNLPVEASGKLVSVEVDGEEFMATRDHAKKLVKKGLGKIVPQRPIVLDRSEL